MAVSVWMLVLASLGYAGTVLATNHAQINEELNEILQNLDAADHNRNYRKNALINHQYLRTDDENDLKSHINLRADDVNAEEISTEENDDELAGRSPFVPNDCHAWLPISQIVPCPSGFGQCMTVCINGCGGYPGIPDPHYPSIYPHNPQIYPQNPQNPQIYPQNPQIYPHNPQIYPQNPHNPQIYPPINPPIPGGSNTQIITGDNEISVGCRGKGSPCPNGGVYPIVNPYPIDDFGFPPGPRAQDVNGGCLGGNSCEGVAFQSQAQTQVRGNGAQSQNQGQTSQAGRGATQSQSQTQARMRAALLRNQARTHFGRTVVNPKNIPPRSNIRLKIYA